MKFLTIWILGVVSTSCAAKINVKRGLLGGQESLDEGYGSGIPSGPKLNVALAPEQPTEQSLQPSGPSNNTFPSQAPAERSLDQGSLQTQLPQQSYLPPNKYESKEETIRAIHTHSVERFPEPIHVERIVYKKIAIDRPVPQPYEVIKHVEVPVEKIKEIKVPYHVEKVQTVQVPYEVEKIKEVIKTVQVPQPYSVEKVNTVVKEVPVPFVVYRDVLKPVTIEKIVPQPYEVVKTVERQVPFYVHQKPQITVTHQNVVHRVAQPVLVSQPQIVHQHPIVHQQCLPQQSLVHQNAEFSTSPVYGYPQPAQIVANRAIP